MSYFNVLIIITAIFVLGNGILHDFFVILGHKGSYDRNLLRLLMDGHILITSGIVYIIAFFLARQNNTAAIYLCIITSVSLLVYCAMIFPFLKSFGTIGLNLAVLVSSVIKLFSQNT